MSKRMVLYLLVVFVSVTLGSADLSSSHAAAKTYYLTIPAAAFTPGESELDYENHGRYQILFNNGIPFSTTGSFVAPLHLPQGAVLTRFTFHYRHVSLLTAAIATLSRNQHYTAPNIKMAEVQSSEIWGSPFAAVSTSTFMESPQVDNNQYQYGIIVQLPVGGNVWNCGVTIEYTLPAQSFGSGPYSVPASSFQPFEDGYSHHLGGIVSHLAGPGNVNTRGWYVAPVYLPDLAAITNLSFYWARDNTANTTGLARLQRTQLGLDNYQEMALLSSLAGSGGYLGSDGTSNVMGSLVDNTLYAYWMVYDLPAYNHNSPNQTVVAYDTVIEYLALASPRPVVSIPAADFRPYEDGYDFENHARHLIHKHGPGNNLANGWYLAPLHLPDGVSIKSMTFYWDENTAVPGVARLQRTRFGAGNFEELGTVFTTTGTNARGSGLDTTIFGGPVDNSRYGYWIVWDLPANATIVNNVRGLAVKIEYDYLLFLPLIGH